MNGRIKIFRVLGSLGSGGAETVTTRQLININNSKFDMQVVISGAPSKTPNSEELLAHGVEIIFLGKDVSKHIATYDRGNNLQKTYCRLFYRAYLLTLRARLFLYFLKERPDIIQLHLSVCYLSKFQYKLLQQLTGVHYCYTCHSTPQEKFSRRREKSTAQFLVNHCGMKLIALHKDMERELQEMFHTKNTAVIHNGLDLDKFRQCKNRAETREELGIPADAWVIGHVGRFSVVKNHNFILDIFKKLLEKDNRAYLLLVGDGELREQIAKKAAKNGMGDRVIFVAHSSQVQDLMRAMDVFAFPSLWEGFGNVLIEAQACELPCVVSSTVNRETVVSEKIQFLDLDSDLWIDALERFKFVKNQPLDTLNNFELGTTVKELETLYEEMMNESCIRQDR